MLKNHDLVDIKEFQGVRYELCAAKTPSGEVAKGLHNAWIWLDNPSQYNSYTTDIVKSVIMAFRKASNDRSVNAIVLTATGDKAFCTGGNTKEYAEYYAGNPQEYKQYMRLFNDMVTGIMTADKPVVCRVNGMRIGGGQEIGMACDFTIAQDLARFGQAGPKHGSAPDGGSTDFLPLFVGIENAMVGCTLCETWSAHQAYRLGVVHEITPALRVDGKFIANPTVVTDRYLDEYGRMVLGAPLVGEALAKGKELMKKGTVDLSKLDAAVEALCAKLLVTFPSCTIKTIGSLRKHKLSHWQQNAESNREWLGLNMMTEAKAGFRAFNEGPKDRREVDFVRLRQLLAEGRGWSDALIEEISPQYRK
ncbi:MAG: 6-oxocyclohex-1-ene-1-carbonyl-CoA hydratase [Deltaproteobacteria bacterium]|nr:6-oxocyclohex-1-ene-1-carbonyl-CoA hydratase [Deltaproteobacteria bacterium]